MEYDQGQKVETAEACYIPDRVDLDDFDQTSVVESSQLTKVRF
jgi:hypothetical protein